MLTQEQKHIKFYFENLQDGNEEIEVSKIDLLRFADSCSEAYEIFIEDFTNEFIDIHELIECAATGSSEYFDYVSEKILFEFRLYVKEKLVEIEEIEGLGINNCDITRYKIDRDHELI